MLVDAPDQTILRGTTATLSVVHLDADGEPAAAAGTVTVGVVDAAGDEVLAPGTATDQGSGTGEYTVELTPAQTAQLDRFTATWSDDGDSSTFQTTIDIVGRYWCTLVDIRALRGLDDTAKFSDTSLRNAREWVTWQIEDVCEQAFVPRFAQVTVDGPGERDLLAPNPALRALRAATHVDLDGNETALTVSEISVDENGWLHRTAGWTRGRQNTRLAYEHGHDRPHPDLKARALHYIRQQLLEDRIGRSVLSIMDPAGITTRFAAPGGTRRPTGDLELDEVIMRYNRSRIVAGAV